MVLSLCVCTGFGASSAVITVLLCTIFSSLTGRFYTPSYLTVLPVFCVMYRFGAGAAGLTVALSGVFAVLLSLCKKKSFLIPEVKAGFVLACALCTTALQTTNYFGIGASGADAVEIIKDYVSLGFHGNWRGVLYGTVVLVVMVTYPRKFKNFSKKVPAPFVAVIATLIMNLFLNPSREFTAINEMERIEFSGVFDNAFFSRGFDVKAIPLILCTALSVALIVTEFYASDERTVLSSCVNLVSGVFGAVPSAPCDKEKRNAFTSAVCAILCIIFFFAFPSVFERIPLHSLAVIIIVSAWQSVEWTQIGKAFKGGAVSVLLFVLAFSVSFVAGAHYAVPIMVILSATRTELK